MASLPQISINIFDVSREEGGGGGGGAESREIQKIYVSCACGQNPDMICSEASLATETGILDGCHSI